MSTLVEALEYAEENCDAAEVGEKLELYIGGSRNKVDEEDKAALEAAVRRSAKFKLAF